MLLRNLTFTWRNPTRIGTVLRKNLASHPGDLLTSTSILLQTARVTRKAKSTMKTDNREKIAVWLDRQALATLRAMQKTLGVPVSESIRRAIAAYLQKPAK